VNFVSKPYGTLGKLAMLFFVLGAHVIFVEEQEINPKWENFSQ